MDRHGGTGTTGDTDSASARPGEPPQGPGDSWRRWLWLGTAAALAALVGAVAVLLLTFEPGAFAALGEIGTPLALALLALVVAAWAAAATRLVLLTRAVGRPLVPRQAAVTAVAAEFGASASPAGVGGVAVRIALLRSYGVPLPDAAAVAGADFAIELVSGVLLGLAILLVALAAPESRLALGELATGGAARRVSLPLLVAVAVLVVSGLALRRWGRRRSPGHRRGATPGRRADRSAAAGRRPGAAAGEPLRRPLRIRLARLWLRSRGAVERTRARLAALRQHPRTLALCLLLAGAQIACRYSVLPALVWAFTGDASPFLLFLVQGAVMGLSHLLVAPGGGGGVELGAGALLAAFLPAQLTGIAVLLWRLYTYHLNLVVGGAVFFAWMGGRGRRRLAGSGGRRQAAP